MADHDYEAGLRDGQINSLKEMQTMHDKTLAKHDGRIGTLEKTSYIFMGAILLLQFAPQLQKLFSS